MDIITSTWTELLQQFFPIFTAPGAEIFSQLMVGWVLCTVRRTVTGILPFADPLAKWSCPLFGSSAYKRIPQSCTPSSTGV
jgi:hypothetical protein